MNAIHIAPGQAFADHVDKVIGTLVADLAAHGHTPDQASITLNITCRDDGDVEVARERALAAGLGQVTLVDDRVPPRQGTVAGSSLNPIARSVAAEARARRVLAEPGKGSSA